MQINVYDEIGSFAITLDDGEKVFDKICNSLKEYNIVTVNFENVSKLCAVFLNASIGKLIKTIGVEKYNEVIKIENLNDVGNLVLERIIYFYNQPLEYQERAEKAMTNYWAEYNAGN